MIKTENDVISCTIDIRVPVTLKSDEVRRMCESRLEDENGRIEILGIGDALFFPRESPLVNALYKAYTDVTGDTENKPMVIGGGTYAKSLKISLHLDLRSRELIIVSTAQMNLFSYPVWKRQFWFIWRQLRIFWQSDEKCRAVIKWRAEHEGSSIFPGYRVSL